MVRGLGTSWPRSSAGASQCMNSNERQRCRPAARPKPVRSARQEWTSSPRSLTAVLALGLLAGAFARLRGELARDAQGIVGVTEAGGFVGALQRRGALHPACGALGVLLGRER